MLAGVLGYVFWHRPSTKVEAEVYERKLLSFQASLKASAPRGLVEALSFQIERYPWSGRRSRGFEDWYIVRDFESLGLLNESAVSSPNKASHDDVAKEASAGRGGLYKLVSGEMELEDARFATWFSKPSGRSYESFYDGLARRAKGRGGRTALWRRQMVLSPAPEFCMHSEEAGLGLPTELKPRTVPLELVGRGGGARPPVRVN